MLKWLKRKLDQWKFKRRHARLREYFDVITTQLPARLNKTEEIENIFPLVLTDRAKRVSVVIRAFGTRDDRQIVTVHSDEMVGLMCDASNQVKLAPLSAMLIQPQEKISFLIVNSVLLELAELEDPNADVLVQAVIGHEFGHLKDFDRITASGHVWAATERSEHTADIYEYADCDETICLLMCLLINPSLRTWHPHFTDRLLKLAAYRTKHFSDRGWIYDYEYNRVINELSANIKLSITDYHDDIAQWHLALVKQIKKRLPKLRI